MSEIQKDVHTEHCCADHGCKYADSDCSVVLGKKPQSFPCEVCEGNERYAYSNYDLHAEAQALSDTHSAYQLARLLIIERQKNSKQ